MPAGTREEKIKFLAAISSLANTAGGDLLIGVQAKNGLPAAISGITVPNIDDEKLRLVVSKLIFPSWLLRPQKEPPFDRSAWRKSRYWAQAGVDAEIQLARILVKCPAVQYLGHRLFCWCLPREQAEPSSH